LVLLFNTIESYSSDQNPLLSCGAYYDKLGELKLQQPPKRVLLVPLLSREPHSTESQRWAEQPARTLAAFYKHQFNADVEQLTDVWSWADYYHQAEQMTLQSQPFDRVIFISHGGFDGPVLSNKAYWQELQINGGHANVLQFSEEQPGLKNILSITYDTAKNPIFSEYMTSHWLELLPMSSTDIWHQLKSIEKQLQPLDQACFKRYCAADKLPTNQENRLKLCELICREPLFELKTSVEISPERFFHFTDSLNSLTSADGLIFFGACNPGSAAPKSIIAKDETELLINSTLAGGPHLSYVHLVSTTADRITAGPIGESSADDIVERIVSFESNHSQRFLCIAAPAAK